MKKTSKAKNKSDAAPKVDPYLEGLVAKLLDRLVSLEKKMDAILLQTSQTPSHIGHEPKPFQRPVANKPLRPERVLYEAICADCNKVCEVPFKPSEDRAVYCKECFARRKSMPNGRQPGPAGKSPIGLTPVVLAPKPVSKLGVPAMTAPSIREVPKKIKIHSQKKSKKKK